MAAKHREGRVLRADAKVCHVDVDGEVVLAAPRGRLFDLHREQKNPVAVGDLVRIDPGGDPAGIEEVLPRRNTLSRVASAHDPREQVLVANVDQLFVVGSLGRPGFSSNRTDRILAACAYEDIPATLVLNKIDLAGEGEIEAVQDTYRRADVPVLLTCALDGRGVPELALRLRGRVSVLYGGSGAGKSSLLNAIDPGLKLRTSAVSKYWRSGVHTTSYSQMLPLESLGPDTWVIDTPGIRVFRLYDVNRAELRDLYPEFRAVASRCRYPDCTHDHEPGCAVSDAVDRGEISDTRYASYLEILDELVPPPPDDTPVPPPDA